MTRTPVPSTNIKAVGYDPETQTLEVEFKHGEIYQYFGVPASVHQELVISPSVGSYFRANVYNGNYAHKRMQKGE